jgi:hypothetical protein
VTLSPDQVDERISKIFAARAGVTAARVEPISQMEGTSHLIDATVRFGPELPAEPVVEIKSLPATPRFATADVTIPEGSTFMPPLMAARFRIEWISYLEETGQTELGQPSVTDVNAFAEREYTTPEENPIAHLIQASGESWQQIQARSGWHTSPVRNTDAPAPRGSFSDFRRPQE